MDTSARLVELFTLTYAVLYSSFCNALSRKACRSISTAPSRALSGLLLAIGMLFSSLTCPAQAKAFVHQPHRSPTTQ